MQLLRTADMFGQVRRADLPYWASRLVESQIEDHEIDLGTPSPGRGRTLVPFGSVLDVPRCTGHAEDQELRALGMGH